MATMTITAPVAEVIADTRTLTKEAWRVLRRQGIGGSDAATVLGLNPFETPMGLYLDKLGLADEKPETEEMLWGTLLEPVVANRFAAVMPFTVHDLPQMLRHRDHPFMTANIDRVLIDPRHPERGPGILECKAPGFRQLPHWGPDKAPDHYVIQVQQYMAVTGYQWGYLAALIGGNRFVVVAVERDEAFIQGLIQAEAAFWHRVQTHQPPPLDGSAASEKLLKTLYARAQEQPALVLPPEAEALALAWRAAKDRETAATRDRKAAEHQLEGLMGEAPEALAGPHRITWANRTRRGIDANALKAAHRDIAEAFETTTAYRVFDVPTLKPKKE